MLSLPLLFLFLFPVASAQYWGRYDCPWRRQFVNSGYPNGFATDPYLYGSGIGPHSTGFGIDPLYPGRMCSDLSYQCPVWASTGQCAINPMFMQRTCGRSCGTCGQGPLGGFGGLGYNGFSPYGPGMSIYETGLLRSSPKTGIHPFSEVKSSRIVADSVKTF